MMLDQPSWLLLVLAWLQAVIGLFAIASMIW